ncbi:MAG TPA: hypothetical protein VGM64_22150 [Lacunisphaera sp.]|jgi:hypothetical protein
MHVPSKIPYNARWHTIAFGAFLFGCCAAMMAHTAVSNDRGVVIDGLLTLGVAGATRFYWVMSAIGAVFVLVALAVRRIVTFQELEFGVDSLVLPHGLFQMHRSVIRYHDIKQLSEMKISSQMFLYLHTHSRKFSIAAALLPEKKDYLEIKDFLRAKISGIS